MAGQIIVKSELEMTNWFEANFKKLGYDKIIKRNRKTFPDFLMLKKGKELRVELETKASHFVLHNHDIKKVDEIICLEKDAELGAPIIAINDLIYSPKQDRISATINQELSEKLKKILVNSGRYRNMSHLVETAIEKFLDEELKRGKNDK